jgi:transposase-like protein
VFAEVVPDRTEATICEVLHRHVLNGSIIHTDCWKGYHSLNRIFGIQHRTVNHSDGFKDPITGVHTNTVEGTNYALKRRVPPRNRTETDLPMFLMEFTWRRKNAQNLWESFLEALRIVTYDC